MASLHVFQSGAHNQSISDPFDFYSFANMLSYCSAVLDALKLQKLSTEMLYHSYSTFFSGPWQLSKLYESKKPLFTNGSSYPSTNMDGKIPSGKGNSFRVHVNQNPAGTMFLF